MGRQQNGGSEKPKTGVKGLILPKENKGAEVADQSIDL